MDLQPRAQGLACLPAWRTHVRALSQLLARLLTDAAVEACGHGACGGAQPWAAQHQAGTFWKLSSAFPGSCSYRGSNA